MSDDTEAPNQDSSDIEPDHNNFDDVIQNIQGRGKVAEDTNKWLARAIKAVDFTGSGFVLVSEAILSVLEQTLRLTTLARCSTSLPKARRRTGCLA
jgi:hypothetical protein